MREPLPLFNLEEVRTRRQAYHDLLDHWKEAKHIGETEVYQSDRVVNVCEELGVVIAYLEKLLMRDYNDYFYAREINLNARKRDDKRRTNHQ